MRSRRQSAEGYPNSSPHRRASGNANLASESLPLDPTGAKTDATPPYCGKTRTSPT
jgi:hypothetical protein